VGQYLNEKQYGTDFRDRYLLPMGAAIWSCPPTTFEQFPIRFIVDFYLNHGLLSVRNRPTWRVVRGGSAQYVKALTAEFYEQIRVNLAVESIVRFEDRVQLQVFHQQSGHCQSETFDEVIFACHSDQALKILGESATATERDLLKAFPYEANTAVLHTDTSLLPRHKRAWASWNYQIPQSENSHATVTYNMNILQNLQSKHVFCVTLNQQDSIDENKIIKEFRYAHPIYNTGRKKAQSRQNEVIRSNRTSFCGAYWGNGFHEDGVNSALAVAQAFENSSAVSVKGVNAHA
jgi:predicted NAD/FAD-binding protein